MGKILERIDDWFRKPIDNSCSCDYYDNKDLVLKACKEYLYYFDSTKRSILAKIESIRNLKYIEYQMLDLEISGEDQPVFIYHIDNMCRSILYDNQNIIDERYRNDLTKTFCATFGQNNDNDKDITKNGLALAFIHHFFDAKKEYV